MTEQKHFDYKGNIHIDTKSDIRDAEVVDVEFLVPIRVSLKHKNGTTQVIKGQVNWATRKAYFDLVPDLNEIISLNMFDFLGKKLTVESDAYAAPDELIQQAGEIHSEFEELYQQNIG